MDKPEWGRKWKKRRECCMPFINNEQNISAWKYFSIPGRQLKLDGDLELIKKHEIDYTALCLCPRRASFH